MESGAEKKPHLHDGHRDRMRERFLASGGVGFADHELLELLLYHVIPRRDTNDLAHRLIETFGSLSGVLEADVELLSQCDGLQWRSAVCLKAVGEIAGRYAAEKMDPEDRKEVYDTKEKIVTYLAGRYLNATVERVYLLLFDNGMHLLDCYHVCDGSIVGAGVSIRRIAEQAYKKGAASAILAHNHPGGYAFPSEEDVRITRRLCQALEILEIPLLEHYIFADKTYAPVLQRCIAWQGDTAEKEDAVAAPHRSWPPKKGEAERRMAYGREET